MDFETALIHLLKTFSPRPSSSSLLKLPIIMTDVNIIAIINICPSSTASAAASFPRHVIMSSIYVIISFIFIVIIIIINMHFKLVTFEKAPGTSTTLFNP